MDKNHTNLTFRNANTVGIGLTIIAAIVAYLTQNSGFLSPIPPAGSDGTIFEADVADDAQFKLYFAAFSAWAALALFVPATVYFCLNGDDTNWRFWWTAGFTAFAIHMFWAIVIFFGGDMGQVMSSTRVSAPVPGLVLLIWWAVDVALSWIDAKGRAITIQRIILHIGAFILFIGGSAATGETALIRILGTAAALIILASLGKRMISRKAS